MVERVRDGDVCAVVRRKTLIAAEEGRSAGFHRCSERGRAKATSGDDRSEASSASPHIPGHRSSPPKHHLITN